MIATSSPLVTLPLAFLDMIGGSELLVVFLLVLIFFGGEKMPEFARGLGKAIREFRKAASGVEQEFKRALEDEPAQPKAPTYAATPTILPPSFVPRPAVAALPDSAAPSATPAPAAPAPTPPPASPHPDIPDEHHVG